MNRFCKWVGLLCAVSVQAAEVYVATDGHDEARGTKAAPLATLQAAAEKLRPGDTCYIRGGTYSRPMEMDGLKGSAGKPIRFSAYPDETVIFDGTTAIEADWKPWTNGVFRAGIDQEIWQVFQGDHLMDLARWPNASVNDGSVWDMEHSMRSTDRAWNNKLGRSDSVTQSGVILDRNPSGQEGPTLADTGKDFTGAVAVLNIGHWRTWARRVLTHEAGSNRFTYDPEGTVMLKFLEYCLYGLPALDAPNEWWFDFKTKTLYFKPETGAVPALRGKVRDYNLVARNCAYLQFVGIDFFATTFLFDACSNMLVEDAQLRYPSTHKFVLGELGWFSNRPPKPWGNAMTMIYNAGEGNFGNVVRNCTIAYPNSPAIGLFSSGAVLDNCCIHDVEWDVNSSGGAGSLPGGDHVTVRNCTLYTTGASEGIRLGAGSTIEGNRVFHTSLLQHDGSAINIGTASQPGTVVRRNWVYDTRQQAIRFDSTTRAFGTDAAVVENVFFKVGNGQGGNKFKGDYQLFAKNTAFDCFVAIPKGFGDTEEHNRHSLVCNNLIDHLVEWNMTSRTNGITARMVSNVYGAGSARRLLRDPDHFDFRPKPSANELIGRGIAVAKEDFSGRSIRLPEIVFAGDRPDIGAYESGASDYWIPGCDAESASSPVPPDGAKAVKTDADLMWKPGRHAERHLVIFGSDSAAVSAAVSSSGKVVRGGNIFDPGSLLTGQTYYWRVDVVRDNGTQIKGPVWHFQVGNSDVMAEAE